MESFKRAKIIEHGDMIVTTQVVPNIIFRLFGAKIHERQYRGWSTVWFYYPHGGRCGTFKEGRLSDMWQEELWRRKDAGAWIP